MHPQFATGPRRYVAGLPRPDRALVMGVLNVTPDSFSDGGRWLDPAVAVKHGEEMVRQGADLVDVGGESTRPGATRPSAQEELDRVLPVVAGLAERDVLVSVDTMRADVAQAALEAGAAMVNDVSGGRADPRMFEVVAAASVPYVLMHWRAHSQRMQEHIEYADVVADVTAELGEQLEQAVSAGVARERIAVDPGIGFSKTPDQNWQVLGALDELDALGQPILVAASRKRFLGALLANEQGEPPPAVQRDDASTATAALAAVSGVWCVRSHSVRASADAIRVAVRWAAGSGPGDH